MKAKVVLLARLRSANHPFVPIKIVRGQPVGIENVSAYYLRYSLDGQRKTEPVGPNLNTAYVAYQNRTLDVERSKVGLVSIPTPGRVRIADAVTSYLADIEQKVKTGERSKNTLQAYKACIESFRDSCGIEYVDQITASVLNDYKAWMFDNIKKRKHGKKINTVAKRFTFLSAFLSRQGIKMIKSRGGSDGLMDRQDVPRESLKKVDKYSEDDIRAMLVISNEDEKDLIQTFLRTGCRDEEVVYLTWRDVDFRRKQIVISEKPQYGWTTKDHESRTLPLEDGVLLDRLKARRIRYPKGELVFPSTSGKPDQHLVKRLHKIVAKASPKHDFEGDISLHRFRRSYASMMIRVTDLQTVKKLLGHSDIQTTERYLAPDDSQARTGTRTAFGDLA